MTITTFDTLRFARQLKDAGVPPEQAEAQAEAMNAALSEALDNQVATKADMTGIKIDIAKLDARLASHDKILWGILLGVVGVIIKLFLG